MSEQSIVLTAYGAVYRLSAWSMRRFGLLNKLARPLANWTDRCLRRWFRSLFSFPNPLRFEGHQFFWEGESYTVQGMFFGTYEKATIRLFRSMIRPGMNVVDAGAHIGCYTVLAASGVGSKGCVHAFEPDPRNADLLARNVAHNRYDDRVKILCEALADSGGWRPLIRKQKDSGSSSLYSIISEADQTFTVQATSLDSFFCSQGWPKIDLIKMDIEGSETAALEGMEELSHRNHDLKLIIEFNPEALESANVAPETFFRMLEKRGFTCISLIEERIRHLRLPTDIPWLVLKARSQPVNLLCDKGLT